MGPTAEQRMWPSRAASQPEVTISADPDWRFGDDYLRDRGGMAQADFEHRALREMTPTEIRLDELAQLLDFVSGDPIDGAPKREAIIEGIKHRMEYLQPTTELPTAEQPSKDQTVSDPDLDLRLMSVQEGEEDSFTVPVVPGTAESWAMVAIQYLRQRPMQNHPISDALVHRILRELTSDVRDVSA